jgi:hypothetical protein
MPTKVLTPPQRPRGLPNPGQINEKIRSQQNRSGPARRERRQREVMAKVGLADFETVQQCSERQQKMARLSERGGELQHHAEWQECEPDFCAASPCRDGCWFGTGGHRNQMITEGHRLLSDQPGDLMFAGIAGVETHGSQDPCGPAVAAAANPFYRSPAPLNMFSNRGLR